MKHDAEDAMVTLKLDSGVSPEISDLLKRENLRLLASSSSVVPGLLTRPMNSTLPDSFSRMRKIKGDAAMNRGDAVLEKEIPVAAAASVPSSFTSI